MTPQEWEEHARALVAAREQEYQDRTMSEFEDVASSLERQLLQFERDMYHSERVARAIVDKGRVEVCGLRWIPMRKWYSHYFFPNKVSPFATCFYEPLQAALRIAHAMNARLYKFELVLSRKHGKGIARVSWTFDPRDLALTDGTVPWYKRMVWPTRKWYEIVLKSRPDYACIQEILDQQKRLPTVLADMCAQYLRPPHGNINVDADSEVEFEHEEDEEEEQV